MVQIMHFWVNYLPNSAEELDDLIMFSVEKLISDGKIWDQSLPYLVFSPRSLHLSEKPFGREDGNWNVVTLTPIILHFDSLINLNLSVYNPTQEPFMVSNQDHLQQIVDILALELL